MPLSDLASAIPAMFRRAAINAALGSARAFSSSLKTWRTRKEKHEAKQLKKSKKKPWRRAATGPTSIMEQVSSHLSGPLARASYPFYRAQSLDRLMLVLAQNTHARSRSPWWLPDGQSATRPQGRSLVVAYPSRKDRSRAPAKVIEQLTAAVTRICAVDLNLDHHLAVCSVQTVDGTRLSTSFIGNGTAVAGCRKQLLGRIARNRSQTGIIAENEQDNADLWAKIRHVDEQIAHGGSQPSCPICSGERSKHTGF
jgi:hypothetical protein